MPPSTVSEDVDRDLASMRAAHKASLEELNRVLRDLYQTSVNMRGAARRSAQASIVASGYLIFANAYVRFVGAVVQGLRRTHVVNRIVERSIAEAEEARNDQERERVRRTRQSQQPALVTEQDTFEDLFGEV
jgi:hypothetical protein